MIRFTANGMRLEIPRGFYDRSHLIRLTDGEAFRKHVTINTLDAPGCWEWQGHCNASGYGGIHRNGRCRLAHRFVYELLIGPIPTGLSLDHLCRNRACVNPAHLEPATARVNILRGIGPTALNAQKTHCKNAHLLEGDNLIVSRHGERWCKVCKSLSAKKHYEKHRSKIIDRGIAWRAKKKAELS